MPMLTCRSTTLRRDSYHAYFDRTFDARRCFSPAPAPRAHDGTLRGRSLFAVPPSRRRVQSSVALPALGHPGGERAVPTRSTLNKGAHSTARVWRIIDGLPSTMVVAARSTLNKGAHSTARTCDAYQTFSRLQNVSTSVARQPPAAYRSMDDASSTSMPPCSRCHTGSPPTRPTRTQRLPSEQSAAPKVKVYGCGGVGRPSGPSLRRGRVVRSCP